MKDVSVEYAHIYTNNKIGKDQEVSLKLLEELKKELGGKSFSLVVLVDDYSFPDPTFDYQVFSQWLFEKGFGPDVVMRESQLIPLCDEVLRDIENDDLKEEITDYIKAKKYPCSLFIAAWYLLRLGHLEMAGFNKEFNAKKLINILPESFKPFEDKALEILKYGKFPQAAEKVQYKFIEGRLVA